MRRGRLTRCLQATVLAAALALPGIAPGQADFRDPRFLKLDEIIGVKVRSADGEPLGRIKDLIVDRSGKVEYIAVEAPGGGVNRYPVDSLVSGEAAGEVLIQPADSASGGSSRPQPAGYDFPSRRRGQEPVINLLDGKLDFVPLK